MIADTWTAALRQHRYDAARGLHDNRQPEPSKLFAPGMTPAKRDLIMVRGDIARHERLLASETAYRRANPNKWEIARVKARLLMLAEAQALAARLEAQIAAEAAQAVAA